MSIYSTQFISEQGLTGTATYTVPAGSTAVVHAVQAYMGSQITEAGGSLRGTAGQRVFPFSTPALTGAYFNGDLKAVYTGPAVIEVVMDGGNADVSVAGWLLTA